MSSDYHTTRLPDLTAKQSAYGAGMDMGIRWMCGHRGSATGARYRKIPGLKPIAWRCAACVKAAKA